MRSEVWGWALEGWGGEGGRETFDFPPILAVLKIIFIFCPWPGGSRGRVRTAFFSKELVGFEQIPAFESINS